MENLTEIVGWMFAFFIFFFWRWSREMKRINKSLEEISKSTGSAAGYLYIIQSQMNVPMVTLDDETKHDITSIADAVRRKYPTD